MQRLQARFVGPSSCSVTAEYTETTQVNLSAIVGLWVVLSAFLACACAASAAWYARERWRRAAQQDAYQEGECMERAQEVAARVHEVVAAVGDAVGSFRRTVSMRGELHASESQRRRITTGAPVESRDSCACGACPSHLTMGQLRYSTHNGNVVR